MDRVAIPTWFLGGRRHPVRVVLLCAGLGIHALRWRGFAGRRRSRVSERKYPLRLFGVREIEDSRARRQRRSDWVSLWVEPHRSPSDLWIRGIRDHHSERFRRAWRPAESVRQAVSVRPPGGRGSAESDCRSPFLRRTRQLHSLLATP
jgi:hypothetical protein